MRASGRARGVHGFLWITLLTLAMLLGAPLLPRVPLLTASSLTSAAAPSLLVQEQELVTSDPSAQVGQVLAVSSDGNTVLAGTNNREEAFVFVRSGGVWSQQQKLTASDGGPLNLFGTAVALSGDGNTALVGARQKFAARGAAYVFVRTGTTWTEQQKLTASDAATNDFFGTAVALNSTGNIAFVGAPARNVAHGAVYIFTQSGTTWTQLPGSPLTASDGATPDQFGDAIAMTGDAQTVLIGAPLKNSGKGATYVFVFAVFGWGQQQELTASISANDDRFGTAVAVSSDGKTALIGAREQRTAGKGSAYIFTRSAPTNPWFQQQQLTASDGAAGDDFGSAVSLSGDGLTALVGARLNTGKAYLFTRIGTTWPQQQTFVAGNGVTGRGFGSAVALNSDGRTAVIGAPFANASQGAVDTFIPGVLHLTAPATSPAGSTLSPLTLSVTDPAGGPPIFYTGTVHFSTADPRATLPADYTFTTADHGTHTFTAILRTAGNQTIAATDTGSPSVLAGATINVTAGPATSLDVNPGTTPQSAQINTAFATPLAVTATDAFANPVGGVTVSFAAPTTGASGSFAGGVSTSITNASGVATAPTFTANATVGSYTVTASAPGTGTASFALTNTASSSPPITGGLQFFPLSQPVRLLDTRPGQTAVVHPGTPLTANQPLSLPGQFSSGSVTIPAGAQALVGNATVDNSVGAPAGFATLYPSGAALPLASNLNFVPGTVRPNAFTVGLGSDGKFNLLSNTGGNFIIDITGYYAPPTAGGLFFHPLSVPVRLLDTRPGQSAFVHPNAALTPGQTLSSAGSVHRRPASLSPPPPKPWQAMPRWITRQTLRRFRHPLSRRHCLAADQQPQLRTGHRRPQCLHRRSRR